MEFFKGFEKAKDEVVDDVSAVAKPVAKAGEAAAAAAAAIASATSPEEIRALVATALAAESSDADPEAPDESLYAPYFPAATRNLAPEISMICERNFYTDRVAMAMTEVNAKASDLHFPKWYAGKAPVIDIFYGGGGGGTSGVSVAMEDIQALPAYVAPTRPGLPDVSLVTGRGGGLKLDIIPQ
jgi:hypothetical protein